MTLTNKRFLRLVVVGAGLSTLTLLGGCRDFNEFEQYRARRDSITFEAGNAVAHNIAVQTVDPWPKTARDTTINVDGKRALISARRYEADKVEEPKGLATGELSSGNGSSGGGSSGN